MRLGIVADIHDNVDHLRRALRLLRDEGVDRIVVIGDVCDAFHEEDRIEQTCQLLMDARAIGVWGNHDFRFCIEREATFLAQHSERVVEYLGSLRPRLEVDGCFFSHVEPWLDPEYFPDLWYGGGPPDSQPQLDRIFQAIGHRVIFAGHYHTWLLATPAEVTRWNGETKTTLGAGRYFVAVGALCPGHFGILDTSSAELLPLRC